MPSATSTEAATSEAAWRGSAESTWRGSAESTWRAAAESAWRAFLPLPVVAAALLALDAGFLHHVWRAFPNWGIWDWDLQASILEVARHSLLVDGEWPLWDRYRGGGWTFVGNPLARTLNPSFLPILLFGTIPGIKIAIGLYLWLAQLGTLAWLRQIGLPPWPALLGALVFTWSGCFTQHLTHGHFEWLAYAWLPWVLFALHRAWERPTPAAVAWAGVALALLWLDGGPYQLAFLPLYVGLHAGAHAVASRRLAPVGVAVAAGVLAAVLAAVQILPVLETAQRIARPTARATAYYGMQTPPTATDVLGAGLLSREQRHDAEAWQPFRLNVGMYVGVLPLLLVALALARPRRSGPLAALLLASLWIALSEELPLGPWGLLHELPGFASLQVPVRFNLFVVATLAALSAVGLAVLSERVRKPWLAPAVVGVVALDLFLVHAPVWEAAFSVPPIEVERREVFRQYLHSPYAERYPATVRYPVFPNWPNATFPTIRENAGVVVSYYDLLHARAALAADDPDYPDHEIAGVEPGVEVRERRFSSNRARFRVSGPGGHVVLNQTFHPDWRVASGEGVRVTSHRGRVAARVPAGEHEVELAFRPRAFVQGAALSAVGWLGVLGVMLYSRSSPSDSR